MSVRLLVAERFGVGESPVWDAESARLLWCDIPAGIIHAVDPETSARQAWLFDGPVASFGLARSGRFVVALADEVMLFDPESGDRQRLARIEHGGPGIRLNDGKVGPDGAFWVGSMDASGASEPQGRLYRIAADGGVRVVAEGIFTSNGLAWNADATRIYHSDSRGDMWIDCWDFDVSDGTVRNRRRLREHDEANGRADGGACDMDGIYWSAAPSCSRLNRFSAEGDLLGSIPLPLHRPTMPCFGGHDLRTVFVTSLDSRLDEAGRDGIACFEVDVPGVPVARFGD
jgi:sugar lactone lactonase YvrE